MTRLSDRPPGPGDDVNAGYFPGHLWRHGAQMHRCTASAAVWESEPRAELLPLDAIGGARPLAAYGTRRLVAGYDGPGIAVVRPADSAIGVIRFRADGALDLHRLEAFLEGATGRIAGWYDQSGNGHHAVQPIAERRPAISASNLTGNAPSITCDAAMYQASTPIGLDLPREVAGLADAFSVLTVSRFASAATSSALFQLDAGPGGRHLWMGNSGSGSCVFWQSDPGIAHTSQARAAQTPMVNGLILGAHEARLITGERTTGHSPISASAVAGGTLGYSDGHGTQGGVELSAVLIYGRALDHIEQADATASLCRLFELTPQLRDTLVFAGDSITHGYGTTLLQTYPRQVERMLDPDYLIYNIGSFGYTIRELSGDDFLFRTRDLHAGPARRNVLVLFAGTNDISGGAAANPTFDHLRRYAGAAKAAGWTVAVATMLLRGDLSPDGREHWRHYSALIRTYWPHFADALVDLAATHMSGATSAQDHRLYVDTIHPTRFGYAQIASAVAEVLQPMLAPVATPAGFGRVHEAWPASNALAARRNAAEAISPPQAQG